MTGAADDHSGIGRNGRLLAAAGVAVLLVSALAAVAGSSGSVRGKPHTIRIVLPDAIGVAAPKPEVAQREIAEGIAPPAEPIAAQGNIDEIGGGAQERPSKVVKKRIGGVEMLDLSFALPGGQSPGLQGIAVEKRLVVAGFGTRTVDIHLHSGSRIEIDGAELVEALVSLGAVSKERAGALPIEPGRQTFAALRRAGIDIGYDAIGDNLVIEPGSAGLAAARGQAPD